MRILGMDWQYLRIFYSSLWKMSQVHYSSTASEKEKGDVWLWFGRGFFSEKGSAGEGRDRAQLKAINNLPTTSTTEVFSFSNKSGPFGDQREVASSTAFEEAKSERCGA